MQRNKRSNIRLWLLALLAFLIFGCVSVRADPGTTYLCDLQDLKGSHVAMQASIEILVLIAEAAEKENATADGDPISAETTKALMRCALAHSSTTVQAISKVCHGSRIDADVLNAFYARAVQIAQLGMCRQFFEGTENSLGETASES